MNRLPPDREHPDRGMRSAPDTARPTIDVAGVADPGKHVAINDPISPGSTSPAITPSLDFGVSRNPPLDELAAAWLCERDDGFGPGRAEAFATWCAADPRHAAMVRQVEKAMAVLEKMPTVRRPLEARFGPLDSAPAPAAGCIGAPARNAATSALRPLTSGFRSLASGLRSRPAVPLGLAAALVLSLAGWWFFAARLAEKNHFVNESAAPQRLVLRDGSVIHLNTHSELRVDFSARERRVQLAAGEAHFEVAHDAAHPFVVAAGGVVVRAIGTAFDVRLGAAAVDVLVEEGRVEVASVKPAPVATTITPPLPPAPQLVSGERVRVPRTDAIAVVPIEKVEAKELREALAWHRRTMVLADVPLEEVVARFNRRNAVQLVLADAELRGRRVGGVLALDQVEGFVALLERGGDIVAERRGPDEIVLRRAR